MAKAFSWFSPGRKEINHYQSLFFQNTLVHTSYSVELNQESISSEVLPVIQDGGKLEDPSESVTRQRHHSVRKERLSNEFTPDAERNTEYI
jgi:hypothetical protein